jgi:hypothetical protein
MEKAHCRGLTRFSGGNGPSLADLRILWDFATSGSPLLSGPQAHCQSPPLRW